MLGAVLPEDRVRQAGWWCSPQGLGSPREQEGRLWPPTARLASGPSMGSSRSEQQGAPVTCAAGQEARLTRLIKRASLEVLYAAPTGPAPLGRGRGDAQAT